MTAYLAAFAELFWKLALVAGLLFAGMLLVALVRKRAGYRKGEPWSL